MILLRTTVPEITVVFLHCTTLRDKLKKNSCKATFITQKLQNIFTISGTFIYVWIAAINYGHISSLPPPPKGIIIVEQHNFIAQVKERRYSKPAVSMCI